MGGILRAFLYGVLLVGADTGTAIFGARCACFRVGRGRLFTFGIATYRTGAAVRGAGFTGLTSGADTIAALRGWRGRASTAINRTGPAVLPAIALPIPADRAGAAIFRANFAGLQSSSADAIAAPKRARSTITRTGLAGFRPIALFIAADFITPPTVLWARETILSNIALIVGAGTHPTIVRTTYASLIIGSIGLAHFVIAPTILAVFRTGHACFFIRIAHIVATGCRWGK